MLNTYHKDGTVLHILNDRRFRIPESLRHHPCTTAPSSLVSDRSLTSNVRKYLYSINRFLFKDAEMHAPAPDIPPDRAKKKEPPDKIDTGISVYLPLRDEKDRATEKKTQRMTIFRIY